jgi:hypothetical protein
MGNYQRRDFGETIQVRDCASSEQAELGDHTGSAVLTCRRIHLSPACSRMPKLKKDVSETSHMRDKPSEPQFHKEVGVKEI